MDKLHVHRTHRSGWLRAAVLGANDGLLSISGLLLGLSAANADQATLLLSGVAALTAGALSMAAGEYVSVSSQADIERADLAMERESLRTDYAGEQAELSAIYVRRGLEPQLAREVAGQLMAHDALAAHARDDIGITSALAARPLQAALASAASFAIGGVLPILAALLASPGTTRLLIVSSSLVMLTLLGAFAARSGGAPILRGAGRVLLWGMATMAIASGLGALFALYGAA